jgi:hypothetical protein
VSSFDCKFFLAGLACRLDCFILQNGTTCEFISLLLVPRVGVYVRMAHPTQGSAPLHPSGRSGKANGVVVDPLLLFHRACLNMLNEAPILRCAAAIFYIVQGHECMRQRGDVHMVRM